MARQSPRSSAFSLLELVIVVVILIVIASIAITRVSAAAQNSRVAAIAANLQILNKAAQMYSAEHDGLGPASEPDGTVDADTVWMVARLTGNSDSLGRMGFGSSYIFGPYIRSIPVNPANGLDTIRIGGAVAGGNIAGWRFDASSGTFQADDSAASASIPGNPTGTTTGGGPVLNGSGSGTSVDIP